MKHAFLLLPSALAFAVAATNPLSGQTTIKSGVYSDPSIWDTGVVPATTGAVVIDAGHHVGMAPKGMGVPLLDAGSLTVLGTLTPNYPEDATGKSLTVSALDVTIGASGAVRAEDRVGDSGGGVTIAAPWGLLAVFPPAFGPLPGTFSNDGMIRGGDGAGGGGVLVDYTNGTALNGGTVRGGDGSSGGSVFMMGETATNFGVLRGGDATSGFAGDAHLFGYTFPVAGTSVATNLGAVQGGHATGGTGGDGIVSAFSFPPFGTADVLNDAGALIAGGDGCRAGDALLFAATNVTNRGTLRAGTETPGTCPTPPPSRARHDPPDGLIEGTAAIAADRVELVGGSSLVIRNLSTPGAISAAQYLLITLAPGGVLDLTQLGPGGLQAGTGTRIQADTILLPAGAALADLIGGGPITVGPGAFDIVPFVSIAGPSTAEVGDDVSIAFTVANAGNGTDAFQIVISGPPGFATQSLVVTLAPGEAWRSDQVLPADFFFPGSEPFSMSAWPLSNPAVAAWSSYVYDAYDHLCAVDSFGTPGGLTLYVEPGAAVTAPFLAVKGGTAFTPAMLAFSTVPVADPGLSIAALGVSLYIQPSGAFSSTLTTLVFGPSGTALLPISLKHPAAPVLYAQAVGMDFSDPAHLPFSNALELQFCP